MSHPPTLVCLHAHPDDEAMLTGATLAKAASLGLRTVVVYGTAGDAGEIRVDLGGEPLGERRAREATAACAELGVARVEFLGYRDSGMAGTPTNDHPDAFCNAPTETALARLVELVDGEVPFAVVGYDANGTYGHPDHLQVHRLAHALAAHLGAPWLLDATYDREYLAGLPDSDGSLDPTFASTRADLTHFVQGEPWFRAKMEAIKCHGSQVSSDPKRPRRRIDGWRTRFGTEWFIARSGAGATDLGPLAALFEPKASWPGPLSPPPRSEPHR
ncbi:MAG: PIG-L family deacetylase [Acidimicrobiia bacterium]|nr:PIG-L family deacetylase [Acidimicrobiia bacterium]